MDLAELDHQHLWHPFTQQRDWTAEPPLIIESAEGCTLIDTDGRRYLDGVSSLWTNVHGHCVPELNAALIQQLHRVAHSTMLGLSHPPAIEFAAELVRACPDGLNRVFYSDNGSTATEVALKMAFQFHQQSGQPQRTQFACLSDAYHGDTLGAVSVGQIGLFHEIFRPLLFRTVALPAPVHPSGEEEEECLNRALDLLDEHGDTLAALIVEPLVQGAAGMKMHSPAFLSALSERARQHGALVIADEVATGFGRTGTLFACEQAGLTPDLLCLAKGIAAGYLPLAATVTTECVYSAFLAAPDEYKQFFHGHTFTGNPLATAVALESLRRFESTQLLEHTRKLAQRLTTGLQPLKDHPRVRSIRQHGVMIGIDLQGDDGAPIPGAAREGHRVAMEARRHGAIVRPLGNTVVLNPPLALSLDEADQLCERLHRALQTA